MLTDHKQDLCRLLRFHYTVIIFLFRLNGRLSWRSVDESSTWGIYRDQLPVSFYRKCFATSIRCFVFTFAFVCGSSLSFWYICQSHQSPLLKINSQQTRRPVFYEFDINCLSQTSSRIRIAKVVVNICISYKFVKRHDNSYHLGLLCN